MLPEIRGDEVEGHPHVFCSVEGGLEVETLDVGAHVAGAFGGYDTVPHQLGGGEVGGACREFTWVVDEVSSDGDAHSIGIIFLFSKIDDDSGVGDLAVLGDGLDFFVGKKPDCVGSFFVYVFAV